MVLITINTLIFGFVTWLPTFFVQQGLTHRALVHYTLVMSLGAPVGCAIGALRPTASGRKPTIIGASLIAILLGVIYPMHSDPVLLPASASC